MNEQNVIGLAAESQLTPSSVRMDTYKNALISKEASLSHVQKRYTFIAYLRLGIFLLGVVVTYATFQLHPLGGMLLGFIWLYVFARLIIIHQQLEKKRSFLNYLIEVYQQEIAISQRDWEGLEEGTEHISANHAFSFDLDIFGHASLYQYMNRSATIEGESLFAYYLTHPNDQVDEINLRQEAIADLSDHHDWSNTFQATGKAIKASKKELDDLRSWMKEKAFYLDHSMYPFSLWFFPGLFLVSVGLWVCQLIPGLAEWVSWMPASLPALFFMLNLALVGNRLSHTRKQQALLSRKSRLLNTYGDLLELVEQADMDSSLWNSLKEELRVKNHTASEAIKQLSNILYYLDQRLNAFMGLVLNGAILWDLQCVYRLEKWKELHQEGLFLWLEVIAKADALNSMGRYAYNHPEFVMPEVVEHREGFELVANKLGHPLLDPNIRVDNDISLKEGELLLITGANMAGKSTFLRTVGVNLILAMNGLPVCAKSYVFSPISMFTSIRASDDLEARASYFYAELSRLKRLIDTLSDGAVFVIVDEMLRGTNSKDKQTGSRRFIERLISLNATGIIATHDLSLGVLSEEYPDRIRNKRFEVEIQDNRLSFDYRLQDGISQNLNATFLMEQMGIM